MMNGESADIIREANAGFVVDAGDPVHLVEKIGSLLNLDEEDRKRFACNARSYGIRHFSKTSAMKRIEWFLEQSVLRDKKK